MPRKNTVRYDFPDSFYHVYGRGAGGRAIFADDADKTYFLELLERYLGEGEKTNKLGMAYPNFHGQVELAAFCVMDEYFHLLLRQSDTGQISTLMRLLLTSYTMYYNKKYRCRGPLLESRYRSTCVTDREYLLHLTRYIHLNPPDYRDYFWSSLPYYVAGLRDDWVCPARIVENFNLSPESYWDLLSNYAGENDTLASLKSRFADTGQSFLQTADAEQTAEKD
ncbi:MAG: transposase [Candidatus Nomurabacteria bacterium]|jgi:REP element-mobilizing transposase RayT|nr:transposase [Candidatus Nomurabacteria bacterium]